MPMDISAITGLFKGDHSLVGINASKIESDIIPTIQSYIKDVNAVLDQLDEKAGNTSTAFQGEYVEAVKSYVAAVKEVCYNVVSGLLQFCDKMDGVKAAFEKNDTSLSSNINDQTSSVSKMYEGYSGAHGIGGSQG